ncbi:SSU ribosomal protein S4P [Alkalispirochaeta americana]|uniref:Small ribosomal subunit protein uS4 n=1 Tax=Alkalispirochaeta americana TaxID=159291 RepID=A0A1N6NCU7_9SPIO|nr:30S ribosomal protein S4 [Alkalispirochaeta americana]SIP89890.1 SSU ribosomal protein S4P [Alkalispirochaeta americana]
MARPSKARGKIARHLGINVFGNPKYDRLLKKKPYGPGNPKKGRIRETEYARQLKEKQKVKFAYGLSERQFRNLFYKAKSMRGVAGHNMLIMLERRLDNVVYRMGMAASRRQARQLVSHGHIHLNGRKMTVPSALVRPGDLIAGKPKKSSEMLMRRLVSENSSRQAAPWIEVSQDDLTGKVSMLPTRDMIPTIAEEQLIVEFYSK